jgi:hypothetical protein
VASFEELTWLPTCYFVNRVELKEDVENVGNCK